MTEFRAQAIGLKKLVSDKNLEIQKLKDIAKDTQSTLIDCLAVVYNSQSESIISEIYMYCTLILGLESISNCPALLEIRQLLFRLVAHHTNRRIVNVVQKMTILIYAIDLGQPPCFCKKKLELLLLGIRY